MSETHKLKCWSPYFHAIAKRQKNFDVRRDDRGFQKGDTVILREWVHNVPVPYFSGNDEHRKIKYILTGGQFGIEPGYVILGF